MIQRLGSMILNQIFKNDFLQIFSPYQSTAKTQSRLFMCSTEMASASSFPA
jgi:hypothetical protein